MATENKANPNPNHNATKSKKRKQRYLPHNKPVKKKGGYPLCPGVQGFFITCDGGRERQAAHEALNVIDSFFEELLHGKDSGDKLSVLPNKPLNKKIKFSYSDSGSDDDDDGGDDDDDDGDSSVDDEDKSDLHVKDENPSNKKSHPQRNNDVCNENQNKEQADIKPEDGIENQENDADGEKDENNTEHGEVNQEVDAEEPSAKKQCLETDASTHVIHKKTEEKSIDKLIEAELQELGDKSKWFDTTGYDKHIHHEMPRHLEYAIGLEVLLSFDPGKRRFGNLDSGCNGVVFVQMRKRDGDPSPKEIVQHMMTSAASTRKHMSRFILRVLPVEATCYASEEEISRAIKPLVEQYFPVETQNPKKFAVLYEARSNTGIDRMKIINVVAKSVPGPHKVDLSNPDMTISVQIAKTVCLIGFLEKYKELAKYNLRQLTSPK